eukprot:3002938-Prymnesium_polylepis.2
MHSRLCGRTFSSAAASDRCDSATASAYALADMPPPCAGVYTKCTSPPPASMASTSRITSSICILDRQPAAPPAQLLQPVRTQLTQRALHRPHSDGWQSLRTSTRLASPPVLWASTSRANACRTACSSRAARRRHAIPHAPRGGRCAHDARLGARRLVAAVDGVARREAHPLVYRSCSARSSRSSARFFATLTRARSAGSMTTMTPSHTRRSSSISLVRRNSRSTGCASSSRRCAVPISS